MLNGDIAPYSLKLEEAGASVDFLDMRLAIDHKPDAVTVIFRPVLRNNGPLLSVGSGHVPTVHVAWTIAYINRLHRRSTRIEDFAAAKRQFLQRLHDDFFPQQIIQFINDNTDYFMSYQYLQRKHIKQRSQTLHIVIPYHPLWRSARLASRASNFFSSSNSTDLLNAAFEGYPIPSGVNIAWSLDSLPLGSTLLAW